MKKLEKKDYLLIAISILFVFLVIPVTVFKSIFLEYFSFIDSWAEKPVVYLKKQIVSRIPQGHSAEDGDVALPDFKFIKFDVDINAKNVYVIGDFNKWSPLNNLRKKDKTWETEVPLVRGRYRYLFLIDGKEILDPLNPDVDYYEGKKVSVIEVK